jgi:hypothetical protein
MFSDDTLVLSKEDVWSINRMNSDVSVCSSIQCFHDLLTDLNSGNYAKDDLEGLGKCRDKSISDFLHRSPNASRKDFDLFIGIILNIIMRYRLL